MGKFLVFSDEHSSLVTNFCHFSTGYISSQFHLFFNDLFDMVIHTRDYEHFFNAICNYLFGLNRYWYAEDDHDETGKIIYLPPLI